MADILSGGRIRTLVIAAQCNPEWTSVPLVGWSHAAALREVADVHIATAEVNAGALERAGLRRGVDFTAFGTDAVLDTADRFVDWLSGHNRGWALRTALKIPSYMALEGAIWRHFRPDIAAGRFDVVHRMTPLSPATPSPIAGRVRRAGVPFVLGPINGGLPWPPEFPELRRREADRIAYLRDAYRILPGYRATRTHANAIIVGSASALADLAPRWRDRAIYMPENGFDHDRFPTPARRRHGRPIRAVFAGRLVPYKGTDLLIEAAAELMAAGEMTLEILGDGPEQDRIEALVAERGLGDAVRFPGFLPHRQVAERLREADILTFPSLREFGGAVVLEAMAMGVVPVVVAYGGPGELISPATGFAIPLAPRAELIATLRATLERIVADPSMLDAMSVAAAARARGLFAWPAKARQTLGVYRWVIDPNNAPRPGATIPLPDPPDASDPSDAATAPMPVYAH